MHYLYTTVQTEDGDKDMDKTEEPDALPGYWWRSLFFPLFFLPPPQIRNMDYLNGGNHQKMWSIIRHSITYPKLWAHGRLAPGCAHLLLVVPAADLLEQVVDEVQSARNRDMMCNTNRDELFLLLLSYNWELHYWCFGWLWLTLVDVSCQTESETYFLLSN